MKHDEETGALLAMILLHVDDILLAHDGSEEKARFEKALTKKYQLGVWIDVFEKQSVCAQVAVCRLSQPAKHILTLRSL